MPSIALLSAAYLLALGPFVPGFLSAANLGNVVSNLLPLLVVSLYLGALVGGFAAVGVWETWSPARAARAALCDRWCANLGLLAINHGFLPLVMPPSNAGAAWFASERGWGLLNAVAFPPGAAFVVTMVVLVVV